MRPKILKDNQSSKVIKGLLVAACFEAAAALSSWRGSSILAANNSQLPTIWEIESHTGPQCQSDSNFTGLTLCLALLCIFAMIYALYAAIKARRPKLIFLTSTLFVLSIYAGFMLTAMTTDLCFNF